MAERSEIKGEEGATINKCLLLFILLILFGSFVNHWTLGCIWSQGRMVTFWGPTQCSERSCIDQWESLNLVMRSLHWLHRTTLFCSSFYGIWVIILWFPDPGVHCWARGQVGAVSLDNRGQYSALLGILRNYEWGYWILEGGTQIGCDAPSWPDWINNWWLHICSHWVTRMLSSFCDKSWLLSRLSFMGIYWFPNWGQIQLWS